MKKKIVSGCDFPIHKGALRPDVVISADNNMIVLTQNYLGVTNRVTFKFNKIKRLFMAIRDARRDEIMNNTRV